MLSFLSLTVTQISQVLPLWMQTASLSKPTLLKSCQRKVFLFLNNVKRVRWRDGWSVTWKRLSPAPLRDEDFRETRQNRKNKHPTYGKSLRGAHTHTRWNKYLSIKQARKSPSARHQSYPGVWCVFMSGWFEEIHSCRSRNNTGCTNLFSDCARRVNGGDDWQSLCVLMCFEFTQTTVRGLFYPPKIIIKKPMWYQATSNLFQSLSSSTGLKMLPPAVRHRNNTLRPPWI